MNIDNDDPLIIDDYEGDGGGFNGNKDSDIQYHGDKLLLDIDDSSIHEENNDPNMIEEDNDSLKSSSSFQDFQVIKEVPSHV